MELRSRLHEVAGHRVLTLEGAADLAALPDLHGALGRLLDRTSSASVAVDVDGITVLDDASVGLLIGAAARARDADVAFRIVCSSPALLARFADTRVDRIVEVTSALTSSTVTPPTDEVS